jgi:hypothetical protein
LITPSDFVPQVVFLLYCDDSQLIVFILLPDTHGVSVFSTSSIIPHTPIVSCPFSICITPRLALSQLSALLPRPILDSLNDHQLICAYISLHALPLNEKYEKIFHHRPYFRSLPEEGTILTPLWWRDQELDLIRGTTLGAAAEERREKWKEEWQDLKNKLRAIEESQDVLSALTW